MMGRIVLGLGGTVDHELDWDAAAFQRLVDGYGIHLAEVEDDPPSGVADERGIALAILRSMRWARGCECYVADKAQLPAFDSRFDHRVTLGGTCVRAALAMDRLGVESMVHLVSISDEVRERLPEGVAWLCSAEEDSLDPHVIVQYPRGAVVRLVDGMVVAARPNRVILVNDEPNEHMVLSRDLPAALREAPAVLVSGFNTMKSVDELRVRLAELADMLRGVPRGTPVPRCIGSAMPPVLKAKKCRKRAFPCTTSPSRDCAARGWSAGSRRRSCWRAPCGKLERCCARSSRMRLSAWAALPPGRVG